MKKTRIIFVLLILPFLAIVTPAQAFNVIDGGAGNSVPVLDGCSPDFWQMQQRGAMGFVAEKMIPAWEIINPPSSTNVLGCFDQSMIASAKAGAIFSDKPPSSTPSFNPAVSIGLGSSLGGPFGPGTTGTLMGHLNDVVDPVLGNLLSNLTGGLTSAIGQTLTSGFSNVVGGLLSGVPGLGGVLSGLMGQNMDCNIMQETWDNQIIGQGLDIGYSFIPMDNLLNRSNLPANLGAAALAQIAANSEIFDVMRNDRENLSTPGYFDFNPVAPTFGRNATVLDIIGAMD